MTAAQELDRTFGALADPTRRQVVELLRERPHRAGDLAEACDATRPAMSRHLRVLRTAGLVETEPEPDATSAEHDARARVYRLRPERFEALRAWLEEGDRFWTAQLDSFAAHVEQRAKGKR